MPEKCVPVMDGMRPRGLGKSGMPGQHQDRIQGIDQFARKLHIPILDARHNAVQCPKPGCVIGDTRGRAGAAQCLEQYLFAAERGLGRRHHGRETVGESGVGKGAQCGDAAAQGFAVAVQRCSDRVWRGVNVSK